MDQRYLIVEDHDQELRALQNTLLNFGFSNHLGVAKSAQSGRDEITAHRAELDLVFLDLGIPESENASRIDNNFGYELLEWIHNIVNRQSGRKVQVIIVSGQYDLTGIPDEKLRSAYEGTLVGVVKKENLKDDLGRVIAQLGADPLLQELIRMELSDLIPDYQVLFGANTSTKDKCKAAVLIACRLLANDGDFREKRKGACQFGDDLGRAISQVIMRRFVAVEGKGPYVAKKYLAPNLRWDEFVWRGVTLEHLYGIKNFRNRFEHLAEQNYLDDSGGEWQVPTTVATRFCQGDDVVEVIRLQVKSLLQWYLPWHEQVYLPWSKSPKKESERTSS